MIMLPTPARGESVSADVPKKIHQEIFCRFAIGYGETPLATFVAKRQARRWDHDSLFPEGGMAKARPPATVSGAAALLWPSETPAAGWAKAYSV